MRDARTGLNFRLRDSVRRGFKSPERTACISRLISVCMFKACMPDIVRAFAKAPIYFASSPELDHCFKSAAAAGRDCDGPVTVT